MTSIGVDGAGGGVGLPVMFQLLGYTGDFALPLLGHEPRESGALCGEHNGLIVNEFPDVCSGIACRWLCNAQAIS